jgi:D-alanyl-D-alanine-carboxypeptidase/D-alanyl-D-alanine-endopeptidase
MLSVSSVHPSAHAAAPLAAILALPWIGGSSLAAESPRALADRLVAPWIAQATASGGKGSAVAPERHPLCVGLVVGLLREAGAEFAGYGVADPAAGDPPDADTLFEIGSITKVFTSLLLAVSVEADKVRLEDPVRKFLPRGASPRAQDKKEIRLIDLATHTSGLPRLPSNLVPTRPQNPYADYTATLLFQGLPREALQSAPGTTFAYSNLGAGLLGQAVAQAWKKPYEDLVLEKIARALGMSSTVFRAAAAGKLRRAAGFSSPGVPASPWEFSALAGAGALRSTARDMVRFAAANIGLYEVKDTRLRDAIEASHKERFRVDDHLSVGLGWHLLQLDGIDGVKKIDEPLIWHNGQTGGFHAFLGILKRRKIGVVILANTAVDIDPLALEIIVGLAHASS